MKDWKLINVLTWANLKSRYRNTFLGFLWVVLNPVITFSVQAYVFSILFKLQHERYFLFLMSGLIPWLMLVQTIEMCGNFFSNNANFFKSLPIQPLHLLKVQVLDNFINFIFTFLLLFLFFIFRGELSLISLGQLLLAIVPFVIFVYSLALILASLGIYFRDLKYVMSFILSIMFYLTPIFYPKHYIPQNYNFFIEINPFYIMLKPFQCAVLFNNEYFFSMKIAFLFSLISYATALIIWGRVRKDVIFYA